MTPEEVYADLRRQAEEENLRRILEAQETVRLSCILNYHTSGVGPPHLAPVEPASEYLGGSWNGQNPACCPKPS
jgi:hypothetical protein